ncbi:MAG: hypothetical protein QME96_04510 [Myxococcota bacterium]|nr:hypothetical protein [Myxococcota bacterium]
MRGPDIPLAREIGRRLGSDHLRAAPGGSQMTRRQQNPDSQEWPRPRWDLARVIRVRPRLRCRMRPRNVPRRGASGWIVLVLAAAILAVAAVLGGGLGA